MLSVIPRSFGSGNMNIIEEFTAAYAKAWGAVQDEYRDLHSVRLDFSRTGKNGSDGRKS